MADPVHLVRRFFGAIKPGPPPLGEERWALRHLLPGEAEIWRRMNNPDRRHAIEVARAVQARREEWADDVIDPGGRTPDAVGPGDGPDDRRDDRRDDRPDDRAVLAAALLHDSGKVVCRFRTPGRVLATLIWAVADDEVADRWLAGGAGLRLRLAQYRRHPSIGSRLLADAGSAPLTYRWAEQHHQPESSWSVPPAIGAVLKACDDD